MAADKRAHITETAIRLFAEKGYHSTSIQEIADAAGVAKGSMYVYFKSKDDLLLAIYNHSFTKLFEDMVKAAPLGASPRERFKAQIRMLLQNILEFRDFFQMQMREQLVHSNEEVKKAALEMRIRGMVWLRDQIVGLYGEGIRRHALDCTNMLQSIIGGYMGTALSHGLTLDLDVLAEYLADRLNDVAEGLMRQDPEPIFREEEWQHDMKAFSQGGEGTEDRLTGLIRQMREALERNPAGDGATAKDMLDSLDVLREELEKPEPKRVIVQGMLSVLRQGAGTAALRKLLRQLQAEAAAVLER